MTTDAILPRRQGLKVRDDAEAKRIVDLLHQMAGRVGEKPAVAPPKEGMIRTSGMDRASFVWFLRCPDGAKDRTDGDLCNHGIGVDRHHYGDYEVRAWAHGAPGVHAVSLHTHEVTLEILETVAKLVGIPLETAEPERKTWIHGTRLGREHFEVKQHLAEDHGYHQDYLDTLSDGGLHGLHDGVHNTTWAYASDLSHDKCDTRTLDVSPAEHLLGTRPTVCSSCREHSPAGPAWPQEGTFA